MLDLKYNFNLGSDNGNLVSVANNRVTDRSQTFSFDQLNRVATAQTTATYSSDAAHCWGQAFGFDSSGEWGNLLTIAGVSSAYTGCTQGSLSVAVNTNNQIVGDTYDAAGNLWVIPGTGGATYVYNAENQMTSTSNSSMSYLYDGDGNRVEKSGTKIYWYGGSEVLDETDTTGSVTNTNFTEYVFFGGDRIARRDSSGDVFYYLADQVDSSRVIAEVASGQTTASMCYDGDFEPYGGEHAYTNTCSQNYKFTGKERDNESGLDMFGARYYGSSLGRFMTPDWAAKPVNVPSAHFGNPQSLNLYSYVQNNPTTTGDPDGHDTEAEKQAKIAAAAAAQKGSDAYDIKKTNISNMQVFKNGSDKCNEFVSDTVKSADGTRPVVDGTGKVPTASQFADPNVKITGLSAPDPMSNAKPGDVVAQDHGPNPNTGNEEGHVGIIVALPHDGQPGQTASANANQGGQVTVNDWGFRSPTANPNNGERNGASSPAPVVRHPLGDPQ
jgi:RHS repeat-associated protein